jgi:hypothetical protein
VAVRVAVKRVDLVRRHARIEADSKRGAVAADHAGGEKKEVRAGVLEIDERKQRGRGGAAIHQGKQLRRDRKSNVDVGVAQDGVNERFGVEERNAGYVMHNGETLRSFAGL